MQGAWGQSDVYHPSQEKLDVEPQDSMGVRIRDPMESQSIMLQVATGGPLVP